MDLVKEVPSATGPTSTETICRDITMETAVIREIEEDEDETEDKAAPEEVEISITKDSLTVPDDNILCSYNLLNPTEIEELTILQESISRLSLQSKQITEEIGNIKQTELVEIESQLQAKQTSKPVLKAAKDKLKSEINALTDLKEQVHAKLLGLEQKLQEKAEEQQVLENEFKLKQQNYFESALAFSNSTNELKIQMNEVIQEYLEVLQSDRAEFDRDNRVLTALDSLTLELTEKRKTNIADYKEFVTKFEAPILQKLSRFQKTKTVKMYTSVERQRDSCQYYLQSALEQLQKYENITKALFYEKIGGLFLQVMEDFVRVSQLYWNAQKRLYDREENEFDYFRYTYYTAPEWRYEKMAKFHLYLNYFQENEGEAFDYNLLEVNTMIMYQDYCKQMLDYCNKLEDWRSQARPYICPGRPKFESWSSNEWYWDKMLEISRIIDQVFDCFLSFLQLLVPMVLNQKQQLTEMEQTEIQDLSRSIGDIEKYMNFFEFLLSILETKMFSILSRKVKEISPTELSRVLENIKSDSMKSIQSLNTFGDEIKSLKLSAWEFSDFRSYQTSLQKSNFQKESDPDILNWFNIEKLNLQNRLDQIYTFYFIDLKSILLIILQSNIIFDHPNRFQCIVEVQKLAREQLRSSVVCLSSIISEQELIENKINENDRNTFQNSKEIRKYYTERCAVRYSFGRVYLTIMHYLLSHDEKKVKNEFLPKLATCKQKLLDFQNPTIERLEEYFGSLKECMDSFKEIENVLVIN